MPRFHNVKTLPSGRYRGRYKDTSGREHGKTFDTAAEAQRWVDEQRGDVRSGAWVDPRNGQITFREWHRIWASQRLGTRSTTRSKEESLARNHLLPRFGDMPVSRISHALVQQWVAGLSNSLAPSSVSSTFAVLRSCLDAAAKQQIIRSNPCVGVVRPRVEQKEMLFLDTDQINRLVDCADDRYRALVQLGCFGGLRIGELIALERRHVDLKASTVRVEQTATHVKGTGIVLGPPKTSRSRRGVNVAPTLLNGLIEHMDAFCEPASTAPVFTSPEGARINVNNFRKRQWAVMTETAGLKGLRLHDMRHTAVALWISTGVSPFVVSQMAGHASLAVTDKVYGHLYPGAGVDLARHLEALMNPGPVRLDGPRPVLSRTA